MHKYVFTFGYGQRYKGMFYEIVAEDSEAARVEMFRLFGDKWAMQYNSREEAGVEQFNLRQLK